MAGRVGDARLTDEDLMARVQADDEPLAFAELYRRHVDRSFRVAQAVGLDAGGAEAALDAGFAAVWRRRAEFRPEAESFRAWAMTIVQSHARESSPDGEGAGSLRGLPVPLAEIVVLALHGEVSHDEISAQLDLPRDPVEGRMRLGAEGSVHD